MSNLAAIIPSPKAPLIIQKVDKYIPGPHELLIKNHLISLNQIEAKIAKLGILPLQYPTILGSTFGGTIEAVGSDVKNWEKGDRVVVSKKFGFEGDQYAAYQRFVVVSDGMVARIPIGMGLDGPVSQMMNATCVAGLLTGRLGLRRPLVQERRDGDEMEKKMLIYGGSSSFGSLAVRYLVKAGYEVVTTSSPANRAFVDGLGAREVLDHTIPGESLTRQLVERGPYHIVVDTISLPATIAITAQVLAAQGGGKLYAMEPAFGAESLPDGVERVFEAWSGSLYEGGNEDLLKWVVEDYIPMGVEKGIVVPMRVEKVDGGLGAIDGALERMRKGVSGVRLVIDPWE